jgi:DNA replication protein DnaC
LLPTDFRNNPPDIDGSPRPRPFCIPLNKPLALELARCEYLIARDNVIALGNSGTGKTHVCLALGLAACQRGFPVSFFTAAGSFIS